MSARVVFRLGLVALTVVGLATQILYSPRFVAADEVTETQVQADLAAGHLPEAEKDARILVQARQASFGPEARETADALGLLVEALTRNDKSAQQETLDLAQRAVTILDRAPGVEAQQLATALCRLGLVLRNRADYVPARAAFERAVDIFEKTSGPDHPDVARALTGLATVLNSAGEARAAVGLLERALAILRVLSPPDEREIAKTLITLGIVHRTLGEWDAARRCHLEALDLRVRVNGPNSIEAGVCLNNLANAERELGMFNQARSHHERALQIIEAKYGPEHSATAAALHSLAVELVDMGDYAGARPLCERALRIDEKALLANHPDVADDLVGLADLLHATGDEVQAETLYKRASDIIEATLGPEDVLMANAANGLGNVMRDTGRFAEADRLLASALAIFEKRHGPEHPDVARILSDIAQLRTAEGRPAEARDLYRRALEIREKTTGEESLLIPTIRSDLAAVFITLGDKAEAAALLRSATPALRAGYGADSLPYAWALEHQARLDALSGRREAALSGSLEARSISRGRFEEAARGLSEREALMFEASRLVPLDLPLTLLTAGASPPEAPARVWEEIVRSRAAVLDEIASRHHVAQGAVSPEVAALREDLARDRAAVARLTMLGAAADPEAYAASLKAAGERQEASERALALAEPKGGRPSGPPRDLHALVRSLPEGSALVGFLRYEAIGARPAAKTETSYAAFVLGAGSRQPVAVALGPAAAIEDRIESWRRDIGSDPRLDPGGLSVAERRYVESGSRLREVIWDPLKPSLEGARQVFIVPDGALHVVSFATLPDGRGGYLAESGPLLHYLSSERDLVPVQRARRGVGMLALADPDYDGPLSGEVAHRTPQSVPGATSRGPGSCPSLATLSFRPVPESRGEVDAIRRIMAGAGDAASDPIVVLAGTEADEGSFKRAAHGRRILHLATHGFFLDPKCLAPSGEEPALGPFGLAGLALAGANRRSAAAASADAEDGILTAQEIASLDLSGTDWVVLSACETGVGRVQSGEGILGLRRAFETAGAATLLMSLWSIDDTATRSWMEALYRERVAGRSTPEAVGAASRSLLDAQRRIGGTTHPYFWGAFVAAGDWH